jgi:lipoprotein-anchoring transpeptidase ErfK/SrfK
LFSETWTLEDIVMPRVISICHLGAVIGVAGWLAACSDPPQPQTQAQAPAQAPGQTPGQTKAPVQKAPATAMVAPQADPVVPASDAPALALDTTAPDIAVNAKAPEPAARQAQAQVQAETPSGAVAVAADQPPLVRAIDQASLPAARAKARAPAGWTVKGVDPGLVRAEVLLDRAGFSPGVIDGRPGDNLRHAVAAYASAHGLTSGGALNAAVWDALTTQDAIPAAQSYRITAMDEAGPFIGDPPKDYEALSKLPALGYSTPEQMLSEKFHMDPKLLRALNPGADFGKAGTSLVVAAPRAAPRQFEAARIEVDKSLGEVRAYDKGGNITAFYPATVGSTERPAPSGTFAVVAVAPHPAYFYDPKRLTFTPEGATGKLKIAPGPNNPVGATWIALTVPTYGIHGSPDPTTIGKRQSHGCVRLTNWDAVELGKAVRKGAKVLFLGTDRKA